MNLGKNAFFNALGTLAYIVLVVLVLQNGEKIFGKMQNYIGPIAFLLIFTLSAIVVATLVLGKPLMLYLDAKKKEAVGLFLGTVGYLATFTVLAIIIALIV